MTTLPQIAALLKTARCPNPDCDGGTVILTEGLTEYVTADMAADAGHPDLEGTVYRQHDPEYGECPWCAERNDVLADVEAPTTTPFSLIPNAQS